MKDVYISLGSNINAEKNIRAAINVLEKKYGPLRVSGIYESEAVGFSGDNFLNGVVAFCYGKSIDVLIRELKMLEDELGRLRGGPKFSSRTIDMDIILFGDLYGEYSGIQIPRDEINKNAYVLLPLKELAPDLKDPRSGKTLSELWDCCCLEMQKQKLWLADFTL